MNSISNLKKLPLFLPNEHILNERFKKLLLFTERTVFSNKLLKIDFTKQKVFSHKIFKNNRVLLKDRFY